MEKKDSRMNDFLPNKGKIRDKAINQACQMSMTYCP